MKYFNIRYEILNWFTKKIQVTLLELNTYQANIEISPNPSEKPLSIQSLLNHQYTKPLQKLKHSSRQEKEKNTDSPLSHRPSEDFQSRPFMKHEPSLKYRPAARLYELQQHQQSPPIHSLLSILALSSIPEFI